MKKKVTFRILTPSPFKDGHLSGRLIDEGITELRPFTTNKKKIQTYQASPELVRAIVSSGCPVEILPEDEQMRNIHQYINQFEVAYDD